MVEIPQMEDKLIRKLGNNVYELGNDALESVVGKLLVKRKMTLSIAESCTGGLIANRITNISGSSKYFKLGVIVYSDSSKTAELGISHEKIKKYGAVFGFISINYAYLFLSNEEKLKFLESMEKKIINDTEFYSQFSAYHGAGSWKYAYDHLINRMRV